MIFSSFFSLLFTLFYILLFKCFLFEDSISFNSDISIINFILDRQSLWTFTRILFIFLSVFCTFLIFYRIFNFLFGDFVEVPTGYKVPSEGLLVGKSLNGENIYISDKSLYKNILVTGSIGSGKTSSCMYPFTRQLISYKANDFAKKLGFLILDVKGNYFLKVLSFAKEVSRLEDVIVIEVGGFYKYNPLDKPDLPSYILANRLKTILLLFSPNNTESYWIDKAEQILECMIDFCRLYNNNYVSFQEIHNLLSDRNYYLKKCKVVREIFLDNKFSDKDCYLLNHAISFLENDFYSLDDRNHNLLKSEIIRITDLFVSDYDVNKTFCPARSEINFYGFKDVIDSGKIVVLNMNIAKFKNLSKVIAAYLKLDFQTEVLSTLTSEDLNKIERTTCFISDEYQEYVTSSDADFFSQSREAKCINIVSTQSYTSIINALNNQNSAKVIIQNLVNKFWFRSDDIFTIEDAQKQIGKEEKKRTSKTISENARGSSYSLISHKFFSDDSSLSESVNSYFQNDFIYDYNFFTQKLKTFSSLSFLSDDDSTRVLELNMLPYFLNNK